MWVQVSQEDFAAGCVQHQLIEKHLYTLHRAEDLSCAQTLQPKLTNAEDERSDWSCQACTFINDSMTEQCTICDTARGFETALDATEVAGKAGAGVGQPGATADWLDSIGFEIPRTELRALSLDQLHKVVAHIHCRFEAGENWAVTRFKHTNGEEVVSEVDLCCADDVNLYDLDKHVIRPWTLESQWSFVETMGTSEQPPDFFVSQAWSEAVTKFLVCRERHSFDRGLECIQGYEDGSFCGGHTSPKPQHPGYLGGRSPFYWVSCLLHH